MNMKSRMRRQSNATKEEGRIFMTADQVILHFLPNGRVQKRIRSGKEIGAQVAERTFAGVSGGTSARDVARKL
jgi:hypothetical protein